MRDVCFQSIDIEIGQNYSGLSLSSQVAANYFNILRNINLNILEAEKIYLSNSKNDYKVFSNSDLSKIRPEIYEKAYRQTINLLKKNDMLINWGGDHSISLSTVAAFLELNSNGLVVWIDAHADLNLPQSSISGNMHGMPVSILLNLEDVSKMNFPWIRNYLKPENIIYIGLRDLDPFEKDIIQKLNIKNYSYEFIQKNGIESTFHELKNFISNRPIHISFDIDSVNPDLAPATGVPVKNGLSLKELMSLAEWLSKNTFFNSVDIVEINPKIGNKLMVDQTYICAFYFLRTLLMDYSDGGKYDYLGKRTKAFNLDEMEWPSQF